MRARGHGLGKALRFAAAATGLLLATVSAQAQTRWTNGRWFDGKTFVERTMYSTQAGVLAERPPGRIRSTIDLKGRYVVPAYGDAHHHGIDSEPGLAAKITAFLRDGIFYVKNPNVIPDLLTPAVRGRINRADSIDVIFANGGLTGTGGHPGPLHDSLAKQGVFPGLKPADMPGRGYVYVDDEAMLASAWPNVLARRPDFIKVFLNGSTRLGPSGAAAGTRAGLSPAVLRAVVERAHAAGLRVTAHVDTADDLATAVSAGVDEAAHMPLFGPRAARERPTPYRIDPAVAVQAGRQGMTVVATAGTLARMHGGNWDTSARAAVAALQRENLELLRSNGVKVVIGSDGISGETPFATAKGEVMYLHGAGLADGLALLRMWAVETPRAIFPNRKIGELRAGYEANFLALDGDPISDPANLHRISLRVKQGLMLREPTGAVAR